MSGHFFHMVVSRGGGKTKNYYLTTSHSKENDAYGGIMNLNNAQTLLSHIHSHPKGAWYDNNGQLYQSSLSPSESDLEWKNDIMNKRSGLDFSPIFQIRYNRKNETY